MTSAVLIQLLMAATGSLGFAVLFNVRGKALVFVLLGGALGWATYLVTGGQFPHDLPNYLYAAMAATLYAEIMARVLKTPTTVLLVTSLIPLIPGGQLYYTMAFSVAGDYANFSTRGIYTISIAIMMALGIMIVMMAVRVYSTIRVHFLQKRKEKAHEAHLE